MEYKGTCHAIRKVELLPKYLVRRDVAELVKDDHDNERNVVIRKYVIYVGDEYEVNLRFWYNETLDIANFKMSDEGFDAILQSATVMSLLLSMGTKISKNGHGFNMEDLEKVLKDGIKRLEEAKILDEVK